MSEIEKLNVAIAVLTEQRNQAMDALVAANVEIAALRKQLEAAKKQADKDE